jgi:diguanylate cyclase (GGDEF)-like protein
MTDAKKTKKQLIEELTEMRQRIAELEASHNPAEVQIAGHARQIDAISAITQATGQTLDLNELLNKSIDKVIEAVQADVGGIYLLDVEQKAFSLKAQRGLGEEALGQISTLNLAEAEFHNVLRWKDPSTPLSEILHKTMLDIITEVMRKSQIQEPTIEPLLIKGGALGIILVGTRKDRKLTPDDLTLLRAMSNIIALGIDNIKLIDKTRSLSLTDELTGLYNRRHFFRVLYNEMQRAQRYGPSSSMVMLDLDHFKEYNERFGHTAGDSALKALAQTLEAELRKTDITFRYGGDEFVIILPGTRAEAAEEVVDRIRLKWAEVSKAQYSTQDIALGLSAGITQFPRDAETADGLVLLAETALYESRGQEGNKSTLVSDLGVVHTDVADTAKLEQVYALAATVDARDPFAQGHWERIATISDMIGKAIKLSHEELASLHAAALLHDIGKVSIPDSIVIKPDKPTEHEWDIIRRHSAEGARIVSNVKGLSELAPIIRHHHESYDGSGYPDGLKGEDIPLASRIINIADAYDTMTTPRPYRDIISREEAFEELRRCAGSQFDPRLVEAFIQAIEAGEKQD